MRSAIKTTSILIILLSMIWLLWWGFGGSHSAERLSDRFIIGGAIVCIVGFLLLVGTLTGFGDLNYLYSLLINSRSSSERQDWEYDRKKSQVHSLFFIFAGAISIGIGVLLDAIFA